MALLETYGTKPEKGSAASSDARSSGVSSSAGSHSSTSSRRKVQQDARDFGLFGPFGRTTAEPSSGTMPRATPDGGEPQDGANNSGRSHDMVEALFHESGKSPAPSKLNH